MTEPTLQEYSDLITQAITKLEALEPQLTEARDKANAALLSIRGGLADLKAQKKKIERGQTPDAGKIAAALMGTGAALTMLGQQLFIHQGFPISAPALPSSDDEERGYDEPTDPPSNDSPLPSTAIVIKPARLGFNGVGKAAKIIFHALGDMSDEMDPLKIFAQTDVYGPNLSIPAVNIFLAPGVRDYISPLEDWKNPNGHIRRCLQRVISRLQLGFMDPSVLASSTPTYHRMVKRVRHHFKTWEDVWVRLVELGFLSEDDTGRIEEPPGYDPTQKKAQKLIASRGRADQVIRTCLLGSGKPMPVLTALPAVYGQDWQHERIWVFRPTHGGRAEHRVLGEDVRLQKDSELWRQLADTAEKIARIYENPTLLESCSNTLRILATDLMARYKTWDKLKSQLVELGIID